MNNKFVFKAIIAAISVLFFVSCDKDFDEFGTGIIGGNHFEFEKYDAASVIAYTQGTGNVQTNNLPINQLGFFNNPVFGKTTANFVGQLELPSGSIAPTFGDNIEIDSVYFSLPYFSTKGITAADGVSTYELDSLYTDATPRFDLSLYENGYFINDFAEPDFTQSQRFFNNQDQLFNNVKKGTISATDGTAVTNGMRLNYYETPSDTSKDSLKNLPQNNGFLFSEKEILTTVTNDDGEVTKTRTAPGMRLLLNPNYFMKKIFEAPADKLASNVAFKQYFRGLYFQVSNPQGNSLAMLNFAKGVITIYYKEDKTATERVSKTYTINLTGNTVNLLNNTDGSPAYLAAIANNPPNQATGDSRLYVKGGQGAMVLIDLFGPDNNGNKIADELETIRSSGWLINEANLTFYIDNNQMSQGIPKPLRVYLYDVNNQRQLFDYSTDVTTSSKPKFNKRVFGGIIDDPEEDGRTQYTVRITNHIRNLVRNALSDDSATNVRLGLVVTESIAETGNAYLQTPITNLVAPVGYEDPFKIDRLPVASVLNHLGVVLYGSNIPVGDSNYESRLKLEIYYTKF